MRKKGAAWRNLKFTTLFAYFVFVEPDAKLGLYNASEFRKSCLSNQQIQAKLRTIFHDQSEFLYINDRKFMRGPRICTRTRPNGV